MLQKNMVIKMKTHLLYFSFSLISLRISAQETSKDLSENTSQIQSVNQNNSLIYLNEGRLKKVKDLIKKDVFIKEAYNEVLVIADLELTKETNPVTNKTQTPPSGDLHDYMSIAPYRWPNLETADGFPWIVRDGEINPMTRGDNTDKVRLSEMFYALDNLSMAYYFSDNVKYANKAKSIIKSWFIDDATKVNPNINYGQGIPGEFEGRRAGMIEWRSISTVVNTIQILAAKDLLNEKEMQVLNTWFLSYYTWVKTNEMGIENDNGEQNHSTCYDYQLVGLARYLGLNDEAKSRLEAAKIKRIATQIKPDGTQPKELGRTKSIHYSSMNLRIMTFVAEMGMPLGVDDLWNYSTDDGRSMKKAFEFLRPFAEGKGKWSCKQITEGGPERAIETETKPLFSIASTIFNEELIEESAFAFQNLSYMEKLQYPPLFKINQKD